MRREIKVNSFAFFKGLRISRIKRAEGVNDGEEENNKRIIR